MLLLELLMFEKFPGVTSQTANVCEGTRKRVLLLELLMFEKFSEAAPQRTIYYEAGKPKERSLADSQVEHTMVFGK